MRRKIKAGGPLTGDGALIWPAGEYYCLPGERRCDEAGGDCLGKHCIVPVIRFRNTARARCIVNPPDQIAPEEPCRTEVEVHLIPEMVGAVTLERLGRGGSVWGPLPHEQQWIPWLAYSSELYWAAG
ncbi:hypothetical protein NDU88_006871 [Pleurodeles waltl]|uniref:Uncharacterized protein n=1 Tax=Pleurodeles waltl TaxID=8319 RepID=A0AAV7TYF4_PLEWA|nr:hypothetical protein NDU88_006871 [Pleurodeles waltl]